MVVLPVGLLAGIDAGLNVTVVAAGLPVAKNVVALTVAPPVVVRLMVNVADVPAVTVAEPGVAAATPKSMPLPVSVNECGLPGALSVIVTVAPRAPVAVAFNVTLTTQLAPGATVAPFVHVVAGEARAKSPALAPPRTAAVMFSGEPPVLLTVTFCAALVELTVWLLKLSVVADRVAAGGVEPLSETLCGLFGASSVMVSEAARVPMAEGVNVTFIVQLAAGATIAPMQLPPAMAKSPAFVLVMVTLEMFNVAVPLLVRVTGVGALVVPTACGAKVTLDGFGITAEAVPVPVSGTVCGLPAASSVRLTLAARAPGAVGVKMTLKVQLVDAGSGPPLGTVQGVPPEPVTVKSPALVPVTLILLTFSVAVPVLVSVTWIGALLVFTR